MSKIIVLFVLTSFTFNQENGNQNIWKEFVRLPSKAHFENCSKQIEVSLTKKVLAESTLTYTQLMADGTMSHFLKKVESGNKYAAELCLRLYPLFRGYVNDLEYFDISMGIFFKKKPKEFLKLLDKYMKAYNGRYIDCKIIASLGEKFVDKELERTSELQSRLRILENVPNDYFPDIREKCRKYLRETIDSKKKNGRKMHDQ
jgi:hypothetical protein